MNKPGALSVENTDTSQLDGTLLSPQHHHSMSEPVSSEEGSTPLDSTSGGNGSRSSSHGSGESLHTEHVVKLSSIEHCMPRAYIRICLAYRLGTGQDVHKAVQGLENYIRGIVRAKPYLAGNVVDVDVPGSNISRAEIRFTAQDYLNYPGVAVKTLCDEHGLLLRYEQLDADGCPPSRLRPEDVSALAPDVDPRQASPVFRVQANLVVGGLIVSFYLHHCISDGTGFDLITSGRILNDDFTFICPPSLSHQNTATLDKFLEEFAQHKSNVRRELSRAPSTVTNTRQLRAQRLDQPPLPKNQPGRGCVLMLAASLLSSTKDNMNQYEDPGSMYHTTNSVVMALLWRHMTRARRPSLAHISNVQTSKLLIPINIRDTMTPPLPEGYFGAAVDSAKAEMELDLLIGMQEDTLYRVSRTIREAIKGVDDGYVRELIAFANAADQLTDVHDIQASNMDRVTGADMYITSWLDFKTYQHDLGMGLGGPDWVRKPWSRDPGSCIILPRKTDNPSYIEVVVQMTGADMDRLLQDQYFMKYVLRVID
ncbi:hypothetical protein LTR64_006490 [Lithohypha guttulata]|uniref:uncharacterized protein n=1 Tax=Lithohypha guttulata TaxID=1690604 RepID=UPI002DE077DD|nr:hypothetical protein LTR51_004952 [Lithohypha guttulata]